MAVVTCFNPIEDPSFHITYEIRSEIVCVVTIVGQLYFAHPHAKWAAVPKRVPPYDPTVANPNNCMLSRSSGSGQHYHCQPPKVNRFMECCPKLMPALRIAEQFP